MVAWPAPGVLVPTGNGVLSAAGANFRSPGFVEVQVEVRALSAVRVVSGCTSALRLSGRGWQGGFDCVRAGVRVRVPPPCMRLLTQPRAIAVAIAHACGAIVRQRTGCSCRLRRCQLTAAGRAAALPVATQHARRAGLRLCPATRVKAAIKYRTDHSNGGRAALRVLRSMW